LPEQTYYYRFLTGEELLRFYARLFDIPRAEANQRIDQVLKLVDLEPARRRQIKTYSKGMQQRIGIAQALINKPDLLILDEPTSGLDVPTERELLSALATAIAGKTAFLIAHRLTTLQLATRVLVIEDGRVVEDGEPAVLLRRGGAFARLHVTHPAGATPAS
jgi:ABC-2 type transport system ATP-binding protein